MRFSLSVLLLLSWTRVGSAFVETTQFFSSTDTPHVASVQAAGEGIYFTGSPRFAHQGCSACHIDGPKLVRIRLGADDPTLFTDGWKPGKVYQMQVALVDQTLGLNYTGTTCTEAPVKGSSTPYVQCNNNAFALEIDSGNQPQRGFCASAPVGGVCPMPNENSDETLLAPGGDAVFSNRVHLADGKTVARNNPISWTFWWTAPAAGSGPLVLYASAVDGGGGTGSPNNDQDPLGDDAVEAAVVLQEVGADSPIGVSVGCGFGGRAMGRFSALPIASAGLLLGLWTLWTLRSRARRRLSRRSAR